MKTTIDSAGRIIIPKGLRESLGLNGGSEVEIEEYGGVIQVRPTGDAARLERRNGRLVVVGSGALITDESMLALRDAGRR